MYFSEAKRKTVKINVTHAGKGKEVELMGRKTLLEVGVGRGVGYITCSHCRGWCQ